MDTHHMNALADGRRHEPAAIPDHSAALSQRSPAFVHHQPSALAARVLLVEDSAGDASLVTSVLSEMHDHYEVTWVTSLRHAVEELTNSKFDCLLVDLGLPDGEGVEIVDVLGFVAGDCAIVVLTGRIGEELGMAAIQHGADDYVLKSELSARGLHRSIGFAIERRRLKVNVKCLSVQSAAVLESLADGVLVLDCGGQVVSANPAAEQILGATVSELVGSSLLSLPHRLTYRDGTPIDRGVARRALVEGAPLVDTVLGLQLDEQRSSWIEIEAHPLPDPTGGADGTIVTIRDVTERIAAEEANRFQADLLHAVGQAVIAVDKNGLIVYWNRAAEDMFGWSESEAVKRSILEVVSSPSTHQLEEIKDAVFGGRAWTGDLLVRRRDGTSFPILATETPLLGDDGDLKGVIGVATDISERKRAEVAAKQLSAIVESSADAIYTVDLEGSVLTWNHGAQELYGYSAEEAVGMEIQALEPGELESEFRIGLEQLGAGETIRVESVRQRRDGDLIDVSLTASPIYDDEGNVVGASSIARDISDRKLLEAELFRQAVHDSLTGLPNRALLADRLSQSLANTSRRDSSVALLFLDLDQFKAINDAHGHLVGDELLVEVADRLNAAARLSDTLARFGGDEFVVVCEDTDTAGAEEVAQRLAGALKDPFMIGGVKRHISASIGIAVSPPLEADPHSLLRYADTAMYEAKARGRDRSRVFDASLADESVDKLELALDLGNALRDGKLEVHYQPIVELSSGDVLGLEALTRWRHPVRGWIPPAMFVPLAEDNGLIAELDRWVLQRACRDGAALQAEGILPAGARLSINVSAHNVGDRGLS